MSYVITSACIGSKDQSCVAVCPVDCIFEAEQLFVIHPEECIDCGACESECPVTAIFPDNEVPEPEAPFVEINRLVFSGMPAVNAAVEEHLQSSTIPGR